MLAIAAGTVDLLMSRLHEGLANTAREKPPTSCGDQRWDGWLLRWPTDDSRYGPRAGSTFMATGQSLSDRKHSDDRFTIACCRQHGSLHNLIKVIPVRTRSRFLTGWTAPPMWPTPPALRSRVTLIPRRCGSSGPPLKTSGSQVIPLRQTTYHVLHHRPRTGRCSNRPTIDVRDGMPSESSTAPTRCQPKGPLRRQRRLQLMAHYIARWTAAYDRLGDAGGDAGQRLSPATRYYYQVGQITLGRAGAHTAYSHATAPPKAQSARRSPLLLMRARVRWMKLRRQATGGPSQPQSTRASPVCECLVAVCLETSSTALDGLTRRVVDGLFQRVVADVN